LTPRKRKLYERIRRKESAVCKLKRKNKTKKMLEDLYQVDRDPLMENPPSSLNAEAAKLLAAIIRNSRLKPKGMRWNFEDKVIP
jgi:hypothetical protein